MEMSMSAELASRPQRGMLASLLARGRSLWHRNRGFERFGRWLIRQMVEEEIRTIIARGIVTPCIIDGLINARRLDELREGAD